MKLMREDALLDLILTNKEELIGNVKFGGSLDCSDYKVVKFRILREGSKENSRMAHSDVLRLTLTTSKHK